MPKRWTAAGMHQAEQQSRRIIGYKDLATLVIAIERHAIPSEPRPRGRRRARHRLTVNPSGWPTKFHDDPDNLCGRADSSSRRKALDGEFARCEPKRLLPLAGHLRWPRDQRPPRAAARGHRPRATRRDRRRLLHDPAKSTAIRERRGTDAGPPFEDGRRRKRELDNPMGDPCRVEFPAQEHCARR